MAELVTRRITAEGAASPTRWLALLHGIYGAGRNWDSIARALVRVRPDWGGVLVDLREHGGSRGFEPPHTLERTSADLDALEVGHPGQGGRGVRSILGHSFGGKIALLRARDDDAIEQAWIVDSTPAAAAPTGSAWRMLEVLRSLPPEFDSRTGAVDALEAAGYPRPVGLWMSANLRESGGRYRWRLDFDAMESLLRDFFRTDLWELVESPRPGLEIHFLRATDSDVLGLDEADRIRAAGRVTGQAFVHDVKGGHWLNADNPDALIELIAPRLPGSPPAD